MFYSFCVHLVRIVMHCMFRIKTYGTENVPKEGGIVIAVNHKSNFDPVVAGITCPRKLRFMAKSELFKNKFFGSLITKLGAFPVQRGVGDIGAIKSAFKIFKNGEAMLIFPEGGRVKNGKKRRAKPGVALIAQKANVPVVPVLIDGEFKWMSKINVIYGKPIYDTESTGEAITSESMQIFADKILDTIYGLSKR